MNWQRIVVWGVIALVIVGAGVASAISGQLSALCSTADSDAVECVRNWVNPATAALTVVAIVYASRQVIEASKQSNAAVRQSMVVLRDDLTARVNDALAIRATIHDTILGELIADDILGKSGAEMREKDEAFRRWMEDFSFYTVFTPLRHAGHFNPEIQKLADKVILASRQLDEHIDDVKSRFPLFLLDATIEVPDGLPEFEKFVLDEQEWTWIRDAHQALSAALKAYLQALENELEAVTLLIGDLDATVLEDARKLIGQREGRDSHRLGYVVLDKWRSRLGAAK